MICPECGKECEADFVDNGVGMQRCGPWVCVPDMGGCGWIEDSPQTYSEAFELIATRKLARSESV